MLATWAQAVHPLGAEGVGVAVEGGEHRVPQAQQRELHAAQVAALRSNEDRGLV